MASPIQRASGSPSWAACHTASAASSTGTMFTPAAIHNSEWKCSGSIWLATAAIKVAASNTAEPPQAVNRCTTAPSHMAPNQLPRKYRAMAPASGPRLALSTISKRSGRPGKSTSGRPVMSRQLAPVIRTKTRLRNEPRVRLLRVSASASASRVIKPPNMADQTAISEIGISRLWWLKHNAFVV